MKGGRHGKGIGAHYTHIIYRACEGENTIKIEKVKGTNGYDSWM